MLLTGMLGTAQSQPGSMPPGYAITQGKAQWIGPFYGMIPTLGTGVQPGTTINVGIAAAARLAASDPAWWVAH